MTTPTPPAPGQVWRGQDECDEIEFRQVVAIGITPSKKSWVEFFWFGNECEERETLDEWLKWSATATLVDGGESNA